MRITFILPVIDLAGGTKAVFEFANHLVSRGHKVFVVYPLVPMGGGEVCRNIRKFGGTVLRTIRNLVKGNYLDWFDLRANLIRVPSLDERFIPDADVIVATWWETAYYVNRYSDSKGRKFYLVQHYEVWGGPKGKVDDSFRLGLKIIVNSTWLENILKNEVNVKTEALILHAPDRDFFYPVDGFQKSRNVVRILMPYRKEVWKGAMDGIKAFEMTRAKYPCIRLAMFGPERNEKIPQYAEFHLRPSDSQLRELYNGCDIFIFPSWYEGFGMPPLEAMACGCAVVTTNVGAVPDYTIPGETALVSEPRDVEGLAQNIIKLVADERERKNVAKRGYDYTKEFTWSVAAGRLEEVLARSLCLGHVAGRI